MKKTRLFEVDGTSYEVTIERKRMRSLMRLTYHASKRSFYCSVSPYASEASLEEFLQKNIPALLKREKKHRSETQPDSPFTYLLGEKAERSGVPEEEFLKLRKKEIRDYFIKRTRYYESIMGIKEPYKVSVRAMKTRYGSNSSKTHSISYSLYLYRYEEAIIDSVIIHELTHDAYRNHGKGFYKRLYRYCPDYDKLRKRLIHNDFGKKEETP